MIDVIKHFLSRLPLDELTEAQYNASVTFILNREEATRHEVAAQLEKYRDDLLNNRGIKNPTWIGKTELQTFIDNLRK